MAIKNNVKSKNKFKNFDETYSLCAFSLAFALLYPNRANKWNRFILATVIISANGGQLFWFITYTLNCLYALDLYNFSRNMTLAVVLILFFIKTYYIIYATDKFNSLLRWMSKDLLRANELPEAYQSIYQKYIDQGKVGEWSWLFIPTFLSSFFPLYAGICMTIGSLETDDFKRMMVHDMDMIYVENLQNDWPFFHLYFCYNCCQCVVLVPNFCGVDGSFCIAITHLRMKYRLMIERLREAYSVPRSQEELKARLHQVIVEHQDALDFHCLVQKVYEPWLFSVFMLTSFMISFNLYQIYLLQRPEPKYTVFGLVAVGHIFLPCYFAAQLTKSGEVASRSMYDVAWENSPHLHLTKMLVFMIARAQKPLIITGWIFVFNMGLFKSILQTSYSFFTLITA